MTTFCHNNPALVDDVSPMDTPNAIRWYGDDQYIYVKQVSGTAVVGYGAFRHTADATATTRGSVTVTAADAIAETLGTVAQPVGIYVKAITVGRWGYLLRNGTGSLYTDDGVVSGDFLVLDGAGTPTGVFDTCAAGEEHAASARALADDNDTTHLVTARVYCVG